MSELSFISHFFKAAQSYGVGLAPCHSFENLTAILSWSLASLNLLLNRVPFSFSSGDTFPSILASICCISQNSGQDAPALQSGEEWPFLLGRMGRVAQEAMRRGTPFA
jgi:hypothetical protein